ncbi:CPBP family intramembrane metalloprotease [bacterium]|nr:CPBP family intramembrane metalloprotease [bacterium]NUN46454.1 CPBP family intramembrane metalloprotease [bacterium]
MESENKPDISFEAKPQLPGIGTSFFILILGVMTGFVFMGIFVVIGKFIVPAESVPVLNKIGLVLGTMLFVLPALIYARIHKLDILLLFRMRRVNLSVMIISAVTALGLVVVTDTLDRWMAPAINTWLDSTIGLLSPELMSERILEQLAAEMKIHSFMDGFLLIVGAVIAAGVCEEILLRGLLQRSLEAHYPVLISVAISSLVFALIHFNPWGGIQIFIIAIVLGAVAWRTQSILPTIVFHSVNNFTVLIFNNLEPSALLWYGDEHHVFPWVSMGGLICTLLGLWRIWILTSIEKKETK